MPQFEQLQKRHQRHSREDSVPTFPERHESAHGNPGNGTDELLGEIAVILSEHDHEVALRHLGQSGLGIDRPH